MNNNRPTNSNKTTRQSLDYDGMGNFTRFYTSTPRDDKSLENRVKEFLKKLFPTGN